MFQIHRTANGEEMMIAQMSDDHLIETIKLFCSRIETCAAVLNGIKIEGGALIRALRPEFSQEAMKEKATLLVRDLNEEIQPYVMEACLRNLNISEFLQQAYERKEKLATAKDIGLSLSSQYFKKAYRAINVDDED
jgi:hypothetical protein